MEQFSPMLAHDAIKRSHDIIYPCYAQPKLDGLRCLVTFDEEGIIVNGRNKAFYKVNSVLVNTYFNIGKIIVENEQNGNIRAEYGKEILRKLSKRLTNRFGSGFSRSNLQNMRLFFEKYKKP